MSIRFGTVSVVLAFAVSCSRGTEDEAFVGQSESVLTDVEKRDFELAFDRAACLCQEMLLVDARTSFASNGDALSLDPLLQSHATRTRRSECGSIVRRVVDPVAVASANGCYVGPSAYPVRLVSEVAGYSPYSEGFCRAEVNSCIASELRLEAESVASAPRSRAVRDALLAEAARRHQASAVEMGFALGHLGDLCSRGASIAGQKASECQRLQSTDYANHALRRIAESVSSLGEIQETLADSAARAGDGLSIALAVTPEDHADALWSDGGRFTALEHLMGGAESTVAYGRADEAASAYDARAWDGAYGTRLDANGRAQAMLGLLVDFRVPFGATLDGGGRVDLTAAALGTTDEERFLRAVYNLLDHRIAATDRTGPYAWTLVSDEEIVSDAPLGERPGDDLRAHRAMTESAFFAFADRALPPMQSPLRSRHGLFLADVREARALAKDILAVQDVRYETVPQFTTGGRTFVGLSQFDVSSAVPERLAFALQNVGAPSEVFSVDPLGVVMPPDAASGAESVARNLYGFDMPRTRDLGAALSLHVLRVHLARASRTWLFDREVMPDAESLEAVRELVDAYVGERWTEYTRRQEVTCTSPGLSSPGGGFYCPNASLVRSDLLSGVGHWSIYFPDGDPIFDDPSRRPFVVRGAASADCIRVGGPGCPSSVAALTGYQQLTEDPSLPPTGRPNLTGTLGVERRRFVVPSPTSFGVPTASSSDTATAYVFWPMATTAGQPPEPPVLVDVIQPARQGSVHVLGGRYAELYADIVAKQPLDPVEPLVASLGLPRDLVPPLESELISDGDAFEDSYATYLVNAARSAATAATSLETARDAELDALADGRSDVALLEEARLAEEETLLTTCGSVDGCRVERSTEVRLGQLVVAGQPFVAAPSPDEIPSYVGGTEDDPLVELLVSGGGNNKVYAQQSCSGLLADVAGGFNLSAVNKRSYDEYMERYLSAALGCTRYFLLRGAVNARVSEIPREVVEELSVGGTGQFPTYRGEIREPLVSSFASLMALKSALEGFETEYQTALSEVRQGAEVVDDLIPSKKREKFCKVGRVLAIVGTIVATIASTVVTFGAASAAIVVVAAVIAAAAATGGAILGFADLDECGGEPELARAEAESTFSGALLAMENLRGIADEVRRTAGALSIAGSRIDRLQTTARIARARRALQTQFAASNSLTDLPEWRALQGFRVQRARRQLFRAQQYAFVARRAIEVRFGVELASLTRAEPFTEAPALWANDVFTVDTATSASAGDDGIDHASTAGEAITDYVEKLADFVRGYPFSRRFRDATDVQVLNLAQLAGEGPDERFEERPIHERTYYACRNGYSLVGRPREEPCVNEGGVAYAELRFSIPRYLGDYLEDRLATGSFNYRHERVALNFVGGGLIDCRRSARPYECYADGNLRYDLRQEGTVFLESYERDMHRIDMEPGVILGARGLAAERVLTNPLSTSDRALISGYERAELWGRPLMGTYTIRIEGRPEIVWSRFEDLQMLVAYRYWTRQE